VWLRILRWLYPFRSFGDKNRKALWKGIWILGVDGDALVIDGSVGWFATMDVHIPLSTTTLLRCIFAVLLGEEAINIGHHTGEHENAMMNGVLYHRAFVGV